MWITLLGLGGMLALFGAGLPIALAMALVGAGGFAILVGADAAMSMVGQITFDTALSYNLSVLPLFILMGNLITRAKLSEDLYAAAYAFVGKFPGGLAMSSVLACAGFSAVCGSSLATAATMSKVAMPSMRKFGYKDSLAAGSIAAGGTLGILIPPSVALVLYGIMTENDIGLLFLAGVVPGIVGALFYCLAVLVVTIFDPAAGPRGNKTPFREKLRILKGTWGVASLFAVIIGGIYSGVVTSTEAAGLGAALAYLLAVMRGGLNLKETLEVLVESARMTAAIFAVLIGAMIFANFVNVAGILELLDSLIKFMNLSPYGVLFFIIFIYFVLGMFLESMSMMLLTIPLFYPLIVSQGFDPIWFGIIVVVVIEIGLITPPVGMNVFILRSTLPDVSVTTIFKGVAPFVLADVVRLAVLIMFPIIVMLLPNLS
jgi:tripartite ATP-independent transporter DctM subunit